MTCCCLLGFLFVNKFTISFTVVSFLFINIRDADGYDVEKTADFDYNKSLDFNDWQERLIYFAACSHSSCRTHSDGFKVNQIQVNPKSATLVIPKLINYSDTSGLSCRCPNKKKRSMNTLNIIKKRQAFYCKNQF